VVEEIILSTLTRRHLDKALAIIINGKTSNISVCNALDKVLIDTNLENWEAFAQKSSN
jgi:glutamate-5-semialdehyde dehydrogenase